MSAGKVLVVLHEAELGGASRAILRSVPGLEERGWRFTFLAAPGSSTASALREEGRVVVELERPLAFSLAALRLAPGLTARLRSTPGYVRAFRRVLHEHSPDLVHANSHTTLVDALLARGAGVPTVFHVHEMFGRGFKWAIGRRLAYRSADEVVAVSRACAEALASGPHRPRVVHNGVPLPAPVERAIDDDGEIRVGTVGVLSRRKGTDLFVEAARAARDQEPRLRFELIGEASEPLDAAWAEQVAGRFAEVGIRHYPRADVGECLRRWDVFALASRRDPFPLSSLEAMAAGLPVVAPAVDGIVEQVTPETGVLVLPESARALAEAIVGLARRPAAERARLGEAGRARVAREFTIEAQVDGLDAAYRAAIARR